MQFPRFTESSGQFLDAIRKNRIAASMETPWDLFALLFQRLQALGKMRQEIICSVVINDL